VAIATAVKGIVQPTAGINQANGPRTPKERLTAENIWVVEVRDTGRCIAELPGPIQKINIPQVPCRIDASAKWFKKLKSWEGKDVHSAMRRVQNEEYDHNRPASELRISFAQFKDQSAPDPRGVVESWIIRHGQRRSRETGESTHCGSHNSYIDS
jgi:hypothetical protein